MPLLADYPLRRSLGLLALAALVAVGLALLLGKAAGYASLADSLRSADPVWLAGCLAGEVIAYVGYILAFRGVAAAIGGPRLDGWTTTAVVFASLGATRLLAAGGAGGLALDYWALRKTGMSRHESVVRVLGLNTLLYGVFGLVAWSAAAALLLSDDPPPALVLPWILGVPVLFIAAGLVSSESRARTLLRRDRGRLRTLLADAVGGVVLIREQLARGEFRLSSMLGAGLYWTGDILCLWAALRAFGGDLSLAAVVVAYATGYVATLVPLPTGGVGGVEAAMTLALVAVGAPLATAVLGVLAYRLFSFWLPTLPGLAVLPSLPRLGRRLERCGAPAATSLAEKGASLGA
jgi:uncharacterized membrane protein YbhN (UPF0104 family)